MNTYIEVLRCQLNVFFKTHLTKEFQEFITTLGTIIDFRGYLKKTGGGLCRPVTLMAAFWADKEAICLGWPEEQVPLNAISPETLAGP